MSGLAYEFIALAPYSKETDADQFARQLRDLISPYFGLSGGHINSGYLLMKAISLSAKNHLRVHEELVMFFFKSHYDNRWNGSQN